MREKEGTGLKRNGETETKAKRGTNTVCVCSVGQMLPCDVVTVTLVTSSCVCVCALPMRMLPVYPFMNSTMTNMTSCHTAVLAVPAGETQTGLHVDITSSYFHS